MSDIKMSDVFELPMLCEHGDGYIYSNDLSNQILFDDSDNNCFDQKEAASLAINSYDTNQAEIARLTKALEGEKAKVSSEFNQGVIWATARLIEMHDQPSMAIGILEESGMSDEDMSKACDYDLSFIREHRPASITKSEE